MNTIRSGRSLLQALDPFVAGLEIGVSAARAQRNRVKLLIRLALAISLCSLQALAQERQAPAAAPSFKPGTNTGTFVFGGGVDTRTVIHVLKIPIGFRIEVRDFYSGLPNYNVNVGGGLQNNLAFTGGLLIKF